MPNTPDGVYARKPWVAAPQAAMPPQEYLGPFASNQERLLSQALASQTMPGPDLQQWVRPNIPMIELFPDKYGYTTTEFGIRDIIDLPGRGPAPQRVESDYSQTPNSTESSSRNDLGGAV